jgi:serine protease Do
MASPGDAVALEVWRDGKSRQITATLQALDAAPVQTAGAADAPQQGRLGLSLRPLQPGEQAGGDAAGLVVEGVSGPAAQAGIRQGDVLLSVNGTPVTDVDQVRDAVTRSGGKRVALLVKRGDSRLFVPVPVG